MNRGWPLPPIASGLTVRPVLIALRHMKSKCFLFVSLLTVAVAAVGCINTVTGTKTAAVPLMRDRVEARYERTLDQVFNASKDILLRNGTISSAGTLFNQTNDVRVLEGKVKQCNVWVRIEALEPRLTALTVQTRTTKGAPEMNLAHELDKEIALELAR